MRGTILGFDAASGAGVINDATGARLRFSRAAWRSPGEPVPGRAVDFEVSGDEALDIFQVPGGTGIGGDDPAKSAMLFGIISLVCALVSFVIPHIAIFTLVAAVAFGVQGKNLGRDLPDKTAYYLSVAGLVISGIALLLLVLTLAACVGFVGLLGLGVAGWHWR